MPATVGTKGALRASDYGQETTVNKQTTLYAPDISCEHCAMAIQRELKPLEGIVSTEVDVPSKTVHLCYADDAALARAQAVLEDIGYPATVQS